MNFQLFGDPKTPTLLLIPGLGVSYEIFLPLIKQMEDRFRIIAAEVDGFTLAKQTRFTSLDDQAAQVIDYLKAHWIGIDPHIAPDDLLRDLTRNSYEIVKAKYNKKKL